MTERPTLTLAFLTHAPASAAEVLEEIEPASGAAFLDEVPTRLAASVLIEMSPWTGARLLGGMTPAQGAAVLRQLPFHDGVALLRLVPAERHQALLDELPARRAQRMKNALRYPLGTVGAWIDPDVPAFPEATPVAEAIRYLRHSEDDSHVFLQDEASGRLLGAVPAGRLLRADAATPLGELQRVRVVPLASRASLASAVGHPGWDRFLVLPVIGRAHSMVGGLSRSSLRRGLDEIRSAPRQAGTSLVVHVLTALGVTCAGLLRASGAPRQSVRVEPGDV